MKFARIEKDGRVGFTNGYRKLTVPTRNALRERLVKLLEEVNGDKDHRKVTDFWKDRAKDCGSSDDMTRAWGCETFERLYESWQELITPPAPPQRQDRSSIYE